MEISGPLDRVIASVLPHEVTHTVFAYYIRCPEPSWADEGGSVLSEDGREKDKHDQLARNFLNRNAQFHLRDLFTLADYPRQDEKVMCLYAQGFSVCDYLVKKSDRKTFLAFVHQGMQTGWDNAAKTYYGHRSVEELEQAWLKQMHETRRQPGTQVAQANQNPAPGSKGKTVVRTTVPPAQPLDPVPIFRGAAPSYDANQGLITTPVQVPTPPGWSPNSRRMPQYQAGQVQLGMPQYVQPPTPVGYPALRIL